MGTLKEHQNFYPEPPYKPKYPEFIEYVEDIIRPKNPILKALSSLIGAGEYLKDQASLGISMEITSLRSMLDRFKLPPKALTFTSISMITIATGYGMILYQEYYDQDQK